VLALTTEHAALNLPSMMVKRVRGRSRAPAHCLTTVLRGCPSARRLPQCQKSRCSGEHPTARSFGPARSPISTYPDHVFLSCSGAESLLQAAAVIGKDVPHALLQAVADESDEGVRMALDIALLHAYLGEFREGIARGVEAVEIADSVGTPYIQVYATGLTALSHCWRGDFASSLPLADRGLRLAEALGSINQIPFVLAARGWALCGLGRGDKGVPLLERGIKVAESSRVLYWHTNLVAIFAEGQLLASDVNRSRDTAARALDLARARREPGFEAWSLRLLGDIANATEADAETAERSYRSALALATSLRLRPLVAHCHLGLGKLYRRTGKSEQAHEHLTTATTMYRQMDMRFYLAQAEAAMRESG